MKRTFSKIIVAAIIACITVFSLVTPTLAAGNHSMSFPSGRSTTTGKQITVRMTSNFSAPVTNISGSLTFDKTRVEFVGVGKWLDKKDVSLGDGSVLINKTVTDKDKIQIVELVFTAISSGSAQFSFSFEGKMADGTTEKSSAGSSVTISGQPVEPTASNDTTEIKYDDKSYTLVNNESIIPILPKFNRSVTKYNDVDISTLTDSKGKYILFYVTENETGKSQWFYQVEENLIEPLEYIMVNDDMYIIEIPAIGNKIPDGDWKIGKYTVPETGVTVDCFESKKSIMSEFYVFLCYYDGESKYYRYDSLTGVLQREPDITLTEVKPVQSTATPGLLNRLANYSSEAKTLIFLVGLEGLLIIALVILIAIKRKRSNIEADGEEII